MKVKELLYILETVNPEHEVILSCDKEGNSFCPLKEMREGVFERDSPFYVEVSESEEDVLNPNCITFYPEE